MHPPDTPPPGSACRGLSEAARNRLQLQMALDAFVQRYGAQGLMETMDSDIRPQIMEWWRARCHAVRCGCRARVEARW